MRCSAGLTAGIPLLTLNPADDANTEMDPVIMQDLGNTDDEDYEDYWSSDQRLSKGEDNGCQAI